MTLPLLDLNGEDFLHSFKSKIIDGKLLFIMFFFTSDCVVFRIFSCHSVSSQFGNLTLCILKQIGI